MIAATGNYADTGMGLDSTLRRPRPLGPLQQPMAGPTPLMPGTAPSVSPGAPLGMPPGMSIALPPPAATGAPGAVGTSGAPLGPLQQPPNASPVPATGPIASAAVPTPSNPSGGPLAPTAFGPNQNLIGESIAPWAAPDRTALAQAALKTFDEQQADTEKLGIQDIGREAAAAGRLGSGMVSTSLGDLQTQLAKARLQEERGLAGDVAGQAITDRAQQVGEFTGERGYQATLDQQALENRLKQFGLEQQAQAQDFSQGYDTNALLAQYGFGGNTVNTLGSLADTYAGQATDLQSGAGDILRRYFASLGQN